MKINATRIELTVLTVALVTLIALALAPAFWGRAYGHECNRSGGRHSAIDRTAGAGQQLIIEGTVIDRNVDAFTLRGVDGAKIVVVLTDKTRVNTVSKSLRQKHKVCSASQIVRGLRLSVEGTRNADGQLVARNIRFDEQQLLEGIASQTDSEPRTAVVNLSNWP